jgi:hypothetical protein
VNRLSLTFTIEDKNKFNDRIKFAKQLQIDVASEMQFTNYCNSLDDESVAGMKP